MDIYCPQCGEEAEDLVEGYCQECTDQNYSELFDHQHRFDEWQKLSEKEKDRRINQ